MTLESDRREEGASAHKIARAADSIQHESEVCDVTVNAALQNTLIYTGKIGVVTTQ